MAEEVVYEDGTMLAKSERKEDCEMSSSILIVIA
jgi:hypothetical protein